MFLGEDGRDLCHIELKFKGQKSNKPAVNAYNERRGDGGGCLYDVQNKVLVCSDW